MKDRFSENNPKDRINWLTQEKHDKKSNLKLEKNIFLFPLVDMKLT